MISRPMQTRGHLEAALTPDFVRSLGIIQAAIAMGPLIYFIVILVIPGTGGSDSTGLPGLDLLQALTLATVVAFASAVFGGKFIFQTIVRKSLTADTQEDGQLGTTERLLVSFRNGHIVRLALLEGSAILGLTVCLLGKSSGMTVEDPLFWVNCLPTVFLCGYAVLQFPTRDRLVRMIEYIR